MSMWTGWFGLRFWMNSTRSSYVYWDPTEDLRHFDMIIHCMHYAGATLTGFYRNRNVSQKTGSQWGLCELHHYTRLPWNWERADRLGGKRKTDKCVLQRKGRLGKKKGGKSFHCEQSWVGFSFVFKTVNLKSCWVNRCCSHPRQKNHGLAL